MLSAGLEVLDERGLSLTFESISYAKVFKYLWEKYEIRVTRASVHERIWGSRDDFRREVLDEVVGYIPLGLEDALLASLAASGNSDEFARGLGSQAVPAMINSQLSGQAQSVKALASRFDDPLTTATLRQALDQRSEDGLAAIRLQLPQLSNRLGLVPKAELGLTAEQTSDLFCVLIAAIAEGGKLNYHAGSHDITAPIDFRSVPSGADQPWRVMSIGIKCFLDLLYETETGPASKAEIAPLSRPRSYPEVRSSDQQPESGSGRRSRADLKRLILSAAAELLLEDLLHLQPEQLNYKSVFAHIKATRGITVHRASIHRRFWENNNDYRLEVLARSLASCGKRWPPVSDAMRNARPVVGADGTIDRQQSAYEIIRTASSSLQGIGASSAPYRRLLQVKAALIDQQDSAAETMLRTTIADIEQQRMRRNKADFRAHILSLGYKVKPEIGLSEDEANELFQTLVMSTAAGTTFRDLAGIASATRPFSLLTLAQNGEKQNWTPTGIAARSYFDQLYEPSES